MQGIYRIVLVLLLAALSPAALAQAIHGRITDATTGAALPGSSVSIEGRSVGTVANAEGDYSLSLPAGRYTVNVSSVGYTRQRRTVEVARGGVLLNFSLQEDATSLDEVVFVGTRAVGRTRLETAVPVDVIPITQVTNTVGQVDLNQILTYVAPSFQSSRQAISDGTDHVDPAQLRGLGPDQVLVLINGKRRHQSALVNVNGTVNRGTVGTDLNAIPATAVDRIEILRDGAAAQYGSDAIAGVINIVLKKQTGLTANLSYGQYLTRYDKNYVLNYGRDTQVSVQDGQTVQAGLNYGFKIGEKGYLNLTGEIVSRGPTNRTGTYTGQVFPTVTGQTDDQVIAGKGLTREAFDMRIGNSKVVGGGVVANALLPLSGGFEAYAFGGYNRKQGNAAGFYRYPTGVPVAVRTNVFSVYPNGFLPEINSDVTDVSAVVGVRGKAGSWNLDLSNTFGQNVFDFGVDNSVNYTQALGMATFQRKFDAGGLTFSQNTVNFDASKRYPVLAGLNVAAGAELRLDRFSIRAGEEASYKNYNTAASIIAGAQVFGGFLPANAGTHSRNSKAVYIDLEQELTRALLVTGALRFENYSDFGSTLNYKFSARYKITNGIALRASTSTGFRAPSMQQRFYAKTNTIFVPQNGQLVPVESGTFTNESEPARILGIPKLRQETSVSYTVGGTVQLARAFELTLDAYQIDIKDRIVLTNNFSGNKNADLTAQLAAANAQTANFFANAIDTRSRGIESVLTWNTRFGSKGNHSLRVVLAGAFVNNSVVKDSANLPRIKASEVLIKTGQVGAYFNREDQSRIEVANPRNKISLMASYKVGKLGLMLRAVRFGEVVYLDPSTNPANPDSWTVNALTGKKETLDQTFSPKISTDVTVSYDLLSRLNLAVGANNLFDVYPDKNAHSGNVSLGRFVYSRRVQQFGFNGRYVFARLNYTL